jgi:hypothetical protein
VDAAALRLENKILNPNMRASKKERDFGKQMGLADLGTSGF